MENSVELIRVPDQALAAFIEKTLKRNGFDVAHVEQEGVFAVVLHNPQQAQAAAAMLTQLLHDLRQSAGKMPVEPLTGQPQPALSGGWFASMGWLTKGVFIACALIYGSLFVVGATIYNWLFFPASLDGLATQPWRLITPMFLHLSTLHLVFNLMWWADLGRLVERFQSSAQLLLVTLTTAAISHLAQFWYAGPGFGGLSGVVYGLLGYVWIYGRIHPASGYVLRRSIVVFMLVWLVICFVGLPDIVANAAHLAGLLSGCALGGVFGLLHRRHHQGNSAQ